jgi:hypothetical protein
MDILSVTHLTSVEVTQLGYILIVGEKPASHLA